MAKVQSVRQNMEAVNMVLDKERTLQFDLNAFAELENRYGSVDNAMKQLQQGKISDIRTILWVALIHEEVELDEVTGEPIKYNITPYQVGSWIKGPEMLKEASMNIAKAFGFSMPDVDNIDDATKKALEEQGFRVGPNGLERIEDETKNA